MSIDNLIPTPPKGKLFIWLSLISVILTIVYVYDQYWGKGNFLGLAKKKTISTTIAQPVENTKTEINA